VRVICPFVELRDETRAALEASGHDWEAVDVSASDTDYCALLSGLWERAETFAIVEQDIVIRPDTLDELEACSGEWCCFASPYFVGIYAGLGCVKFAGSLLARNPEAMRTVSRMSDATHPPGHWCRLDGWMQIVLRHEPRHLHDTVLDHAKASLLPSHGCAS